MMIKNYHNDGILRKSLSSLATAHFGLDFERLYQAGYWGEPFGCYGIKEGDDIVANVCFHLFDYEKDHHRYRAMQIGTVMTREDYRHKGLAAQLMHQVMDDHPVDVVYLFANESVLNFYPKFNFQSVPYLKYISQVTSEYKLGKKGRKLDIESDRAQIDDIIKRRIKNSKNEYVYFDDYIKMFYLMYAYSDCIYLHEDALVICEKEGDVLRVYDCMMTTEQSMYELIGPYTEGVKKIYYDFEAPVDGLESYEDKDSKLFIKTTIDALKKPWSYPGMSVT